MNTSTPNIGDWVRPWSNGIWRVSRVLHSFNEFRYTLGAPAFKSTRTLIFSNRLVNDSWKRSFASECSEKAWVNPISTDEEKKIAELLLSNEKLSKDFESYQATPKPIHLTVNLSFGPLPNDDQERFKSVLTSTLEEPIKRGLTLAEVLEYVRAAGYYEQMNKSPTTTGLQLVCPDHELRGPDFVMRNFQIRTH